MSIPGEIQKQEQGAPPQPVVSSAPNPTFQPPDLPQSQLPVPQESVPVIGEGQQGPLLAGKYQTPQELERAYLESQQQLGRVGQEVGSLRDQFFAMQQQQIQLMQGQQRQPQQPAAPVVDPEQEKAKREYEMLDPIVKQRVARAGEDADENAIWEQVLGEYQIAQAAAQMTYQPLQQQQQQNDQLYANNLGQQVLSQRLQQVFTPGKYQSVQPQQFMQMVAPSLDMRQFLNMPEQEQINLLEMAADNLEMRSIRGQQAQQALAQQGMYPQQQPPNPYAPQPQQIPQQPQYQTAYQPPQPLPYQGQYNPMSQVPQGQVPNTMAPMLPQGSPQYNPQYQERMDFYTRTMGLTPERAARAAQESIARDARGR